MTRQRQHYLQAVRIRCRSAAFALAAGGLLACGAATDGALPPDVQDPSTVKTPAGAIARYRAALAHVGRALDNVTTATGIVTDELAGLRVQSRVFGKYSRADARSDLSIFGELSSNRLHRLRAQAREARGFLTKYAPNSSPALQAHMLSVEAYAEVMLADLFCSGIPLSTVDFEDNFTFAAGSTTREVYDHAIELFDSALAMSSDSDSIQNLATVGRARALLENGRYAEAAAAATAVPDDYRYQVQFNFENFSPEFAAPDSAALWYFGVSYTWVPGTPSAADKEGSNGLDYRSSGDPRTASNFRGLDSLGNEMYSPAKYPDGTGTFTLASGIEARLIEAEAALRTNPAGGQWLAILNHLRQTAWMTIIAPPEMWMPGPLPDLVDPGNDVARVDMLFRERAFWLYLTAHRQADLRRLIREYTGRTAEKLYPTGTYPGGEGRYGSEIVVPVPESERELNPKYVGCFHRNA